VGSELLFLSDKLLFFSIKSAVQPVGSELFFLIDKLFFLSNKEERSTACGK